MISYIILDITSILGAGLVAFVGASIAALIILKSPKKISAELKKSVKSNNNSCNGDKLLVAITQRNEGRKADAINTLKSIDMTINDQDTIGSLLFLGTWSFSDKDYNYSFEVFSKVFNVETKSYQKLELPKVFKHFSNKRDIKNFNAIVNFEYGALLHREGQIEKANFYKNEGIRLNSELANLKLDDYPNY